MGTERPVSDADRRFLAMAFALAARGLGRVWPNPAVGCVIVQGSRVVGRGWTQPGGRPHAEAMALAQAGPAARGATAYVTLEPCAHHGRTPPCADALVTSGIARVVSTLEDPDPRVSGRGFARLHDAGIPVTRGVMTEEARAVNRGFLTRITLGRPMVTLKLATTLDGRIATATGESRWITGPEARRLVHLMRARHDGILVGAGTARSDNPMLDVRGIGLEAAAPVRVVADARLSLGAGSRLVASAGAIPLWVACGPQAPAAGREMLEAAGAELMPCATGPGGGIDLPDLLTRLGTRGMTRLMCEGGARLAAALLRAGLVDRLVTFTAGRAIGGEGTPAIAGLGLERLADAPAFRLAEHRRVGTDLMSTWERG
ncbi:bifunctional diaminohydroxyphosphoribosylaminopyrimidine deaminase/5-amino-6-(5-phosphoribosylamino)uracil reductase RibD [Oceanicella sp. SM1341]|uniref:bifunctional diaminohydroxyphosphoribosylaminopyrimidine deaminase/5-amino-6-(5-phosphoribosylamino)uracil reductase RibD n=1 Tax=Oceanicella sp. SM1341 TaxID=1548889 RepID=UPI000E4C6D6B|nr:bifunctional diaminohydroxyphosphoribosylaminopyrimidine deaminase/5-amino-6-(5-phosphoribosylamino)uracil reductase RibD [Oceanicella sp. SM1341]